MSNTSVPELGMWKYLVYILISICQICTFSSNMSGHMPVSFSVPTHQKVKLKEEQNRKEILTKKKRNKKREKKSRTRYNISKVGEGGEKK